ncbi:MAG: adenylate/guanylate cyclase domain-containing protein [Deltaproteobacteria bacterium]|nr:adenylate/guanylate cyclase domain-containing protein [Deltaproteobacteria bacterium]
MPPPPAARSRESFLLRAAALPVLPANLAGAVLVYLYFNFVDPLESVGDDGAYEGQRLAVFLLVVTVILAGTVFLSARWFDPLARWRRLLREGADPASVPATIRRRVLNAPLANTILTLLGWTFAGTFYLVYLGAVADLPSGEVGRITAALVFVAGPLTAAFAFLASELYLRRQVPVFFPDGRIERSGVLRVPILARLGGTFAVTSILPLALMMLVDFGMQERHGAAAGEVGLFWTHLVRAQGFIAVVTGVASLVMAWLVARFINRPVQALRAAMARVAAGDLSVRAPVRSADELGELSAHFNAMVDDLRTAERTREIFGRYVSPAVAREALERGVALGGEIVVATAMFVDLRGFTATSRRASPVRVVEMLTEYYALVERACEREDGVITQFLGDGVVVVFGHPLQPLPGHARAAVRAAITLQRMLAERNAATDAEPLVAGIGICTGDMVAGNVGTGGRVTYTIVGDAVNQAARLQVMTRDLPAWVLITASTRESLGADAGAALRPCGPLAIKGLAEPVEIWAVDDEPTGDPAPR